MKKYIFLALLTMGVSSCQLVDVLDQKPEFEADLDGAITTPAAVELATESITPCPEMDSMSYFLQ